MSEDLAAGISAVPTTQAELAALEASYQPFHSAAAWRRVHVDGPRWSRYAQVLTRRINAAVESTWPRTQDLLFRAAALESGALDGLLPANPELTARVLSASVELPADDEAMTGVELIAECNRRALILASELAADGVDISENMIAVLQDVITETQASYTVTTDEGRQIEVELPRRQYKPVTNYLALADGRLAVFAPANRVAEEMQRLIAELGSAEFASLHPVVQAAYAHYALTAIHPFADGNGRLARVVASMYLLRAVGVPLLIFADQWPSYYQALDWAGRPADRQLLADYVATSAISAMDLAANLLARPVRGEPAVFDWAKPSKPRNPQPSSLLDVAARALLEALSIELREMLVAPPPGVRLAIAETRTVPAGHIESAYRVVADPDTGKFGVRVAVDVGKGGAQKTAELEFVALASELPHDMLPVALRETHSNELLEVALAASHPLVLESTAVRARLWALRLLEQAMAPMVTKPARRRGASAQATSSPRLSAR